VVDYEFVFQYENEFRFMQVCPSVHRFLEERRFTDDPNVRKTSRKNEKNNGLTPFEISI
jgi:hypothetical protein